MAHAIVMPSYGMYTAEGTLVRWVVPSGTEVAAGDVVAELETEKALAEVTAPASGILFHVATPGTQLEVESLMGYVLEPGEAPPAPETPPQEVFHQTSPAVRSSEPSMPTSSEGPLASPNARRLAKELGVDLAQVTGTGPGGRISEADVRAVHGEQDL